MLIFKLLFRYLGKLLKFFGKSLPYFGKFFGLMPIGIFIVTDFFINWVRGSLPYAFENMAKSLFSAELVINKNVHLAIADAPQYNLWAFIQILVSLYILISLIRFIGFIQENLSGAQSRWGAYIVAVVFTGIIEVSAIAVIDGTFGFIPIYNGILFLIWNIKPVLFNIFGSSAMTVVPIVATNVLNSTNVSTTMASIGLFFGRKGI